VYYSFFFFFFFFLTIRLFELHVLWASFEEEQQNWILRLSKFACKKAFQKVHIVFGGHFTFLCGEGNKLFLVLGPFIWGMPPP
jgi:hypothetical protein